MFTLTRAVALCLLFVVASCGSAVTTSTTGTSTATIALTDAASDDVDLFEVDVENITLTRLDDSTVSVMAKKARVDFAQLETVTELLVGVSIPVGVYKNMSMTLDFAGAQVFLRGKTTQATILDENGSTITGDVTVNVVFPANSRPRTIVGHNHLFLLDLDLNQSLAVNLTSNSVTFSPVATAELDPKNPKPVFTTGILKSVNVSMRTVTVERRTLLGAVVGTYVVSTTSTTVYQIDGRNFQGTTGLATLAGVSANSRVFVKGTLSTTSRTLVAATIETGNGSPGNGQDYVIGHIVARDNGSGANAILTVLGRSVDVSSSVRRFSTTHTVSVNLGLTKVLKRHSNSNVTINSLNVGQRIAAFGIATGTALDATGPSGVVRMLKTSVWGTANVLPSGGTLTLNASRIGRRPIGSFNFTVGSTIQALSTAFTVDVSSLSTAGITIGSKIRAIGFINPVDIGGDRNMLAESFVNRSTSGALLLCQWVTATTTAVTSTTSTAITLDVSSASIKVIGDGFGTTTLSNTPAPPTIQPLLGVGVYRIIENGAVELHHDFHTFSTSLSARIGPNSKVFRVAAWGTRSSGIQTIKALTVSVVLL
jgi:hypothetical protein